MTGEPPPPQSALTLRIVLSAFGVVLFAVSTVLAVGYALPSGWVIVFGLLTGVALVDLVVVAWRKYSESS